MDASFCKNRSMVCCEKLCIFFFPNMQVGGREFASKWVKFLAYTTLKLKILAFNNSFYYAPNTKHQTSNILYFLPFHLNILFLLFLFSSIIFLSLSSSLSLSTQQIWPSQCSKPIPTPSTTTGKQHQQPIPTYLSNKLTLFHLNPANPYPSQPPPLGKKKKKPLADAEKPTETHRDSQTQKTTTSTKPKIGEQRRLTDSPQNPEK